MTDRTFTGTYEGSTYVEYYARDGVIRGEQDGEKYTASWKVVGDTVCFTYPEVDCDAGPAVATQHHGSTKSYVASI